MRLSPAAIRDFQAIWQQHFGEVLGDDEANDRAVRFLRLFLSLLEPLPQPERAKGSSRLDSTGQL